MTNELTREDIKDLRDDIMHILTLIEKVSIKQKKQQEQIQELMEGELILSQEIAEIHKKILKDDWRSKLGRWDR
tara:strand:- start:869 stop:1090 length:222 start_codon:yes stop_codon:yes gene_type:complete